MALTLDQLRARFPAEGLFAGKDFLLSPEPLRLDAPLLDELQKLGHRLHTFQRACNELYLRSHSGKAPAWVAAYLDAGKPAELLDFARQKNFRADLPRVIRPDLLLTETGFAITELDSVPGGIGLTAWLAQQYPAALGGARGMLDGFRSVVGENADILVSDEAATYRPEMEWMAGQMTKDEGRRTKDTQPECRVHRAEDFILHPSSSVPPPTLYRFFELFDLPNIPAARAVMDAAGAGARVTPPFKPWMEEKLWLALLWMHPLRDYWRRELSDRHFQKLRQLVPQSWVLDPTPLPHHAVIPGLEIADWRELGDFSQKQRDLVLKVSGFSPLAWGSRGVIAGSDVPQGEWAAAVARALEEFATQPRVLMRFAHTRVIEHPYFDPATGEVRTMRGRARLCPYYFVDDAGHAALGGVLATIAPADKKIVHGMKDAILTVVAE